MTCTANAHTTCYGLIDIVAWSRPTGTRRTWASRRGAGDGAAPIPSVAVRGPHSPVQLDEVGRERQVQPAGEGGRHEAAGGAGLPEALWRRGRWSSRRRWFPWRARSRVRVAE